MKARWISLGVALGLALALTVGFTFASGRSTAAAQTGQWAGMEAMHDSPAMQRMHAQMPEELQARCDVMHEQMDGMMGSGGMMDPGSGGMMDPGSSGMMGSGSSGMMGS